MLRNQVRSHDQRVNARGEERPQGIVGTAYDRFPTEVEGSVQNHWNVGELIKLRDKIVVQGVICLGYRLHASGHVCVDDAGDEVLLFWEHLKRECHERRVLVDSEIACDVFSEDRGSKWSKLFAELDCPIDSILDLRVSRIPKDRAVPQCAWTKLHAALEPPNDLSCGEQLCCRPRCL